MAFDYKKEYKEFYLPPQKPQLVTIPPMNYIAVRGKGDPNEEGGEYKEAIGILYAVAFTIKMSKKSGKEIDGFFDYVVPPLEGFWKPNDGNGFNIKRKSEFIWTSVIRLPDFVSKADFDWAVQYAGQKKNKDFSKAQLLTVNEGACVQIMHIGDYDDEDRSIALMDEFISENGYRNDFSDKRLHHEIYLSDARRVERSRLKTVIRHPVKKI